MPISGALQRIRAHFEGVLDGDLLPAYTPAKPHTLTPAAGGSTIRLRSIGLIVTHVLGLLLSPLTAGAQQPGKVARIGFLANTPPTTSEMSRLLGAFPQGLRDLGYVEGQNITIEYRWAEGRLERYPDFVSTLPRLAAPAIVPKIVPTISSLQLIGAHFSPSARAYWTGLPVGVTEVTGGLVPLLEKEGQLRVTRVTSQDSQP